MASGDMPEGIWESVGALELGCEGLYDSPRPEVLALLAEVRCAELSGHEEVTPGVVCGLRVSYLRWWGLEGTPPSDDGMLAASMACDVGSRVNEESIWPPLMCAMSETE